MLETFACIPLKDKNILISNNKIEVIPMDNTNGMYYDDKDLITLYTPKNIIECVRGRVIIRERVTVTTTTASTWNPSKV